MLPLFVLTPRPVEGANEVIQTTSCTGSSVTTISCTSSNTQQSNTIFLIAVSFSNAETSSQITVTSSSGQYVQLACLASNTGTTAVYYSSGGNGAYTITWTGGSATVLVNLIEVFLSGTDGIQCYSATGTSTAPKLTNVLIGSPSNGIFFSALYANNPSSYAAGTEDTYVLLTTSTIGGAEYAVAGSTTSGCSYTLGSSVAWADVCFGWTTGGQGVFTGNAASSTTVSVTESVSYSLNDLIVVCATSEVGQSSFTIADSLSTPTTFTSADTASNTALAECWYGLTVSTGSSDTFTLTAATSTTITLTVLTATGLTDQDVYAAENTGTGTSYSVTSPTFYSTAFAMAVVAGASTLGTKSYGSGWTGLTSGAATVSGYQYRVVTATNTCAMSGTTSASWAEVCVFVPYLILAIIPGYPGLNTAALSSTNTLGLTVTADGTADSNWVFGSGQSATNRRAVFLPVDPGSCVTTAATSSGSTSTEQWTAYQGGATECFNVGTSTSTTPTVTVNILYYQQWSSTPQITPCTTPSCGTTTTFDSGRTFYVWGIQAGISELVCTISPSNGAGETPCSQAYFTDNDQYLNFSNSAGGSSSSVWVTYQDTTPITSGGTTPNADAVLFPQSVTTTTTVSTTATTTQSTTAYSADPPSFDWLILVPFVLVAVVLAVTAGDKKRRFRF